MCFVAFQYHPLVLEMSALKQTGVDLLFGIDLTSCNHENPTNFHAGCVQDFARVEGWIFFFGLETIREKKHGCEHSQKGVGRKKKSDLMKINKKWAATLHKLITAMEHAPF